MYQKIDFIWNLLVHFQKERWNPFISRNSASWKRKVNSGNVFDQAGNFVYQAKVGVGLRYKPILIPLPTAREVLDGEIPTELKSRFSENEILQVIDCIGD